MRLTAEASGGVTRPASTCSMSHQPRARRSCSRMASAGEGAASLEGRSSRTRVWLSCGQRPAGKRQAEPPRVGAPQRGSGMPSAWETVP